MVQLGQEAELNAMVLVRHTWRQFLDGARCIFFVNHVSVLSASINGSAKGKSWRRMLLEWERVDAENSALYWFARVASQSNIADHPLRADWRQLLQVLPDVTIECVTCVLTGDALVTLP